MIKNAQLNDALGNPAVVTGPDGEPAPLSAFAAASTVVWNLPGANLTIGDSERARVVLQQLRAAELDGNLWEPTPAVQAWLLEQLRAHAPRVFGVNAISVVEAFE